MYGKKKALTAILCCCIIISVRLFFSMVDVIFVETDFVMWQSHIIPKLYRIELKHAATSAEKRNDPTFVDLAILHRNNHDEDHH